MKCEQCNKVDANVHVQQTINGDTFELHLCSACASALGYQAMGMSDWMGDQTNGNQSTSEQLWSQFFGIGTQGHQVGGLKSFGQMGQTRNRQETKRCPSCGMTLNAFAKSSFLGCSQCYETFAESLDVMLKRMQAGNRHVGRKMKGFAKETTEQTPETQEKRDEVEASVVTEPDAVTKRYQQLKEAQNAAVAREDYEEAARIRNQIRAMTETLDEKGASTDDTDE